MIEINVADKGNQLRRRLCHESLQIEQIEGVKVNDVAIFVSKRVQRIVAGVLCLIALQMTISLSSCHPEFTPSASMARVHLGN